LKRWRGCAIWVLIIGIAAIAAVRLALPALGRSLIRSDALAKADVVVILSSGRLERTLEAGKLVREGWSDRILISRTPDVTARRALDELNVRIPSLGEMQRDILLQMGIPNAAIEFSPAELATTRLEAAYVATYARRRGAKRIIAVTSPYHTARAGRYLRSAAGGSFTVIMRPNRYEEKNPSRWWRRAPDRTEVVLEYMKIIHGLLPWSAALPSSRRLSNPTAAAAEMLAK
jgi:uncharacterized SAM-binding protein YcdF (DUF218 family)